MRSACLVVTGLFLAAVAEADPVACRDPLILVETDDEALFQRVCDVGGHALPRLRSCHLSQQQPVVLSFVEEMNSFGTECFGQYRRSQNSITLLTPNAFERAHDLSDFCDLIPPQAHFDSILVHELAHALVDQNPEADSLRRLDQEFIAYALQLDSLPMAVQESFLSHYGPRSPDQADRVNDFFLVAAPAAFAAASWLHFSAQEDGCELVDRILRGEYTFWSDPW